MSRKPSWGIIAYKFQFIEREPDIKRPWNLNKKRNRNEGTLGDKGLTSAWDISVVEKRILCWISGHIKKDKIKNECIREKPELVPIAEKMVGYAYNDLSANRVLVRNVGQ